MSAEGSTPREEPSDDNHPRAAVAVLSLAGIVVALMQTVIVPLIPQLPHLLHARPEHATWALTITLLVGAVITPIGGRLGDMYGKRRMLLASMGAVTVGSAVCAVSSSLPPFCSAAACRAWASARSRWAFRRCATSFLRDAWAPPWVP